MEGAPGTGLDGIEIVSGVSFSLVIVLLVGAIRMTGLVPTKFAGLLAAFVGLALGIARALALGGDVFTWAITGLMLGLMASGGYSTVKNTAEGMRGE